MSLESSYARIFRDDTAEPTTNVAEDHNDVPPRRKQKHPAPLFIGVEGGDELTAFSDSDWNNSKHHLSTTGFIVFHGNNPISWASKTQRSTARSVGESEFISISCCAQELQYLRLLKASIQQSSTAPSAKLRATDEAEHAIHIFKISRT